MSRPRPPLHDPYGLLRQPPSEAPGALYSTTSNALTSTTSLPLPTNSPNRRNRQRGVSPSRTQHGEEYEDQPYLTNVVRHHGQVTLVPPVNQGRARKPKRRKNPEATTSTVSLADTLARPGSSSGPSRVSAEPRSRSPRRPRQGSEARAVSSPDVRASPYPDYPPPSFEEVLALDRNDTPSNPTGEPTGTNDVPSPMFLVSAPPALSDPTNNPVTTSTPWERDRLMGFSLEERVRREFERNLKQSSSSGSALVAENVISLPQVSSLAPVPSSPTAASVAASNFLTPQNLTPSPSSAALPISTNGSPKASEPPTSLSPPPVPSKSPEVTGTPTEANETLQDHDAELLVRKLPTESQVPRTVEPESQNTSDSAGVPPFESASSERAFPPESPPSSRVPLTSLLFTTRLRLDSSPERSPVRESRREPSPTRNDRPVVEAGASQTPIENVTQWGSFHRTHLAHHVLPVQEAAPAPSRATSPVRNLSPSLSSVPHPSSPEPPAPIVPSLPTTSATPARVVPEPPQSSSSATPPRRPPPPPPPRPRPRQVGSGIAARISAYETLLANAPKVPPPIPPRPRPRSQTTLTDASIAQPERVTPGASSVGATGSSIQIRGLTTSSGVEAPDVPRATHITTESPPITQSPRPARPASFYATTQPASSPSRPANIGLQDAASPALTHPQSDRPRSRPLPAQPVCPVSMSTNAQAPVPSRSGSASLGEQGSSVTGDTHTTSPTTRPRSVSRLASVAHQGTASPVPTSPRPQSNELEPRPLPAPTPSRPERPASANVQPHALVPARIGPDGKFEIIPDAEVIWLDKLNAGTPEPLSRPSGSRTFSERSPPHSVPPESMAGPANRGTEVNPFDESFLGPPAVAPPMSRQSSTTSSVYQPLSPAHPPVSDPGPSSFASTDSTSAVLPPPRLADDFEYTDLDLLISRLEENEASRQGANYEQLLTVGEVLGPAHPRPPRPDFDLNVGLIEIQRRRVMKDGRVKLKLSLMGVGVDKCGICLTQFKNNESAVLLPCLHSFHTNCIMSWFVRQDVPACPHCRAPVPQ